MLLKDLEVYKLTRELSKKVWEKYECMNWEDKKIIGDQWIRAIDSISANIAEGFGRFHYLDKNKFNYNARGSLFESLDWTEKLFERKKITDKEYVLLMDKLKQCHKKLNSYIKMTKSQLN